MAEKQSIKRFIVRDPHGHIEQEDSFSVVGEVHVDIVPGHGEPYAESEYINGTLTITIYNIEGNGIASFEQVESSEADGGVNTWRLTDDTGSQYDITLRNGTSGDGIESVEQTTTSQESGGVNIITVTTKGGKVATFQVKNGEKGDTVILGEGVEYTLYNSTGDNTDGAMTQSAVTKHIAKTGMSEFGYTEVVELGYHVQTRLSNMAVEAGKQYILKVNSVEETGNFKIGASVWDGTSSSDTIYLEQTGYEYTLSPSANGVISLWNMSTDEEDKNISLTIINKQESMKAVKDVLDRISVSQDVESLSTTFNIKGNAYDISVMAGRGRELYENSGYIWGNGILVENQNFISTDLLKYNGGDIYIYCYDGGEQLTNYGMRFFDEKKIAISRYESGESSAKNRFLHILATDIPNGTKYFAASVGILNNQWDNSFIVYGLEKQASELLPSIDKLLRESEEISVPLLLTSGKVILRSGSQSSLTGAQAFDYIPVNPGESYLVSGKITSTSGWVGYNASKEKAVEIWFAYNTAMYKTASATDMEITIPDGVYFIRGCSTDAINNPVGLKRKVTTKEEIKIAYQKSKSLTKELTDVGGMKKDIVIPITNLTDDKYILSTNGNYTSADTSRFPACAASNDLIPVTPGKKYKITGKVTQYIGWAGYNSSKVYNSIFWRLSNSDVVNGETAEDLVITIPEGIYYLKVCTVDRENYPVGIKEIISAAEILQEAYNKASEMQKMPPMIFKVTGESSFEIWSLNETTKKYLIHPFVHDSYTYDMTQYGGPDDMVCGDAWDVDNIQTESNETILQGNLNFIYKVETGDGFENENLHVGTGGSIGGGHGCEVKEYTKVFVDGTEIVLENLVEGTKIECSAVRFVQKSKCYAPDSSISSTNSKNYPKIVNGSPVITAIHFMDATYMTNNRIKWRNKLIIKRDGVKFSQLHGGMLRSFSAKLNHLIADDDKCSVVEWGKEDETPYCTPVGDSYNYNNNKKKGSEVVMYGGGITVRQRMYIDNGARTDKSFLYGTFYSWNSMKMYFMPAEVSVVSGTAETFNTGDIISVTNEREIEMSE